MPCVLHGAGPDAGRDVLGGQNDGLAAKHNVGGEGLAGRNGEAVVEAKRGCGDITRIVKQPAIRERAKRGLQVQATFNLDRADAIAQRFDDLKAGKADAFVADDRYMALAQQEGYPVLANTTEWKQAIAGNSVRVEWDWIKDPKNRDTALRFLRGTIEGMAIYMNDEEETLRVLAKYHGIKDRAVASAISP